MVKINIAVSADHRGYIFKEYLKLQTQLGNYAIVWHDFGTFSPERTDYPPFAQDVVHAIRKGEVQLGIVLCGSGIGMAIAANRFPGIYAGVAWNPDVARKAKEDDNVNVLSIPADFVQQDDLKKLVEAWLSATFKQGRYADRLAMIDQK